jgi:type IV secretion system protein VirB3
MDKPREVAIHQSLIRPHLLLGGDRELVLFSALIAVALVFTVATWWSIVAGMVFWLVAAAVLSRMGKADPKLRHVYLCHLRYRAFYPAKSLPSAVRSRTPKNWRRM